MEGEAGVISLNFAPSGCEHEPGNMILGNLVESYPDPGRRLFRVPQHTIGNVLKAVSAPEVRVPIECDLPAGIETSGSVFVGYLMLDALIGNTDRHHENWGFVRDREKEQIFLAPTYDHAAGMGSILRDDERQKRLMTKDSGYGIPRYCKRARSAFFQHEDDSRPLTTFEAFLLAAESEPVGAAVWLNKLSSLSDLMVREIFSRIPSSVISSSAAEFAVQTIVFNREQLLT